MCMVIWRCVKLQMMITVYFYYNLEIIYLESKLTFEYDGCVEMREWHRPICMCAWALS
jgi:hypothetical protein